MLIRNTARKNRPRASGARRSRSCIASSSVHPHPPAQSPSKLKTHLRRLLPAPPDLSTLLHRRRRRTCHHYRFLPLFLLLPIPIPLNNSQSLPRRPHFLPRVAMFLQPPRTRRQAPPRRDRKQRRIRRQQQKRQSPAPLTRDSHGAVAREEPEHQPTGNQELRRRSEGAAVRGRGDFADVPTYIPG